MNVLLVCFVLYVYLMASQVYIERVPRNPNKKAIYGVDKRRKAAS